MTAQTADQADGELLASTDVAREAGISFRQLDHWTRCGYLMPGREWRGRHWGSGSNRTWPAGEMEIARRMGRLTAAGILPRLAASFARNSWPKGEIMPGIAIEVTDETPADGAPAILSQPLEALWPGAPQDPIATRTLNSLLRDGIRTVGALTGRTGQDLLDLRHFGHGQLREVQRVLAGAGLSLAEHPGQQQGETP
jgi:Bacterial RNA polymerase, alpha chain C terminal domain